MNAGTTTAGRKLKSALERAAAAAHAQTQPAAGAPATTAGADEDPASARPAGAAQAPNPNDPTTQQDSTADLQALAAEVANALNRTGANGTTPVAGGKTAADQSGKIGDGSGKDPGVSEPADGTPAAAGAEQAQQPTDQQQPATAQPTATNAPQPVAAALAIATVTVTPASAGARAAIDPQGNARGKAAVSAAGTANSAAQDVKDAATSASPATSNAGSASQTDSARTKVAPASASQTAASQTTNNTSSGGPANAPSTNDTASQPQGQPQPAGALAAAFAVAAGSAQGGGGHAGQGNNDINAAAGSGAGAQQIGAAGGNATANAVPNLGVQTANTSQTPAGMPTPLAAAVPIAGLAVEIAARSRAGSNQFDIRLDPPELGRIDVRLDVDRNGQVTSHVTVDRPDTLQLLQSQQPQLQRALEQAGLTTTNNGLQFTLRDQSFAGQNGGGNGGQPRAPQLVIPDPKLPAIDTTRLYSRWNLRGGLDIRV